jgi:hypothetical protein
MTPERYTELATVITTLQQRYMLAVAAVADDSGPPLICVGGLLCLARGADVRFPNRRSLANALAAEGVRRPDHHAYRIIAANDREDFEHALLLLDQALKDGIHP